MGAGRPLRGAPTIAQINLVIVAIIKAPFFKVVWGIDAVILPELSINLLLS
jgi:hypothetical protein